MYGITNVELNVDKPPTHGLQSVDEVRQVSFATPLAIAGCHADGMEQSLLLEVGNQTDNSDYVARPLSENLTMKTETVQYYGIYIITITNLNFEQAASMAFALGADAYLEFSAHTGENVRNVIEHTVRLSFKSPQPKYRDAAKLEKPWTMSQIVRPKWTKLKRLSQSSVVLDISPTRSERKTPASPSSETSSMSLIYLRKLFVQ